MHIEPGVVTGAKIALSYATGAGAAVVGLKLAADTVRRDGGLVSLAGRSAVATALVFSFFQILPHYPVGVSEVHLILGSTLFLMFGAGPAAIGLALGLLIQGVFFAPFDLPQYGMNVTTLIVPLWGISALAKRIIPERTPYVETSYLQALSLSTAYQGGIVAWVAFWAFYGEGVTAQSFSAVATFGGAYMLVIVVEPLIDLAVLAAAKSLSKATSGPLFARRLHQAA